MSSSLGPSTARPARFHHPRMRGGATGPRSNRHMVSRRCVVVRFGRWHRAVKGGDFETIQVNGRMAVLMLPLLRRDGAGRVTDVEAPARG